jgi:hypothetical protein
MTLEELKQVKFKEMAHCAMTDCSISLYIGYLPDELGGKSIVLHKQVRRNKDGFATGNGSTRYRYILKSGMARTVFSLEKLLELINSDLA